MIWKLFQAIYNDAPLPTSAEELEIILEDAEFFHIEPQLYQLLADRRLLGHLPEAAQRRLKAQFSETCALNLFIQHENDRLMRQFDNAGIAVIPLKGVRFAIRYFGHLGARATTDIDLLVQPEDLPRAEEIIRRLGFTTEEREIRSHYHRSYSRPLNHSPHPLTVELHWGLLMEGTSRFNTEELWQEAHVLAPYRHVLELSDYHNFYMICLHGWKHGMDSLKYLLDIVQMVEVHEGRIDYERLHRDGITHLTYKRLCSVLSIVKRQFPYLDNLQPNKFPLNRGTWWNYQAIRYTQKRSLSRYLRFLQYLFLEYDRPGHSLTASRHYWEPMVTHERG